MKKLSAWLALAISTTGALSGSAATTLVLTATNHLPHARANQTLELTAAQLAALAAQDLSAVHVLDATGAELLVQAVDTDYDALHKADLVIFQADFAANEAKTFTVTTGRKPELRKDQFKAFGRFVRERFDDFAWENDRIAHRTYGSALESWAGEPLTSSTIDVWSKRTPRMIINDWYLADHYHTDSGEGADFYSAGKSRGCGGSGLWAADQLWTSQNFVMSRVLANGPIRVLFELEYMAFDVNGAKVSEVKRISLDAGSQLDHFQSSYRMDKSGVTKLAGLGLKKVAGEKLQVNAARGWLLKWEKVEKNAGNQGLALIVDPKVMERATADNLNQLLLAKLSPINSVDYWAGFCWDQAGILTSPEAWQKYVDDFAEGLASPIAVTVTEQ